MSISPIFPQQSQSSKKTACSNDPLVVRTLGDEILEIFLDRAGFLFGLISNPRERDLKRRVSFLPLQKVLPEHVSDLQRLLSPKTSFLRMKAPNVIQIEPKLLGGVESITDEGNGVKKARELSLKLIELNSESILKTGPKELFDEISLLAKDLTKAERYLPRYADFEYTHKGHFNNWYVAKTLHMAVDVLLLFTLGRIYENQKIDYSAEQKKATLELIRKAKKSIEIANCPLVGVTLPSLDLAELGILLLPDADLKQKSREVFAIGRILYTPSFLKDLTDEYDSGPVSELLETALKDLGVNSSVSPNLYADSLIGRFILLNKKPQEAQVTDYLRCLDRESKTRSYKDSVFDLVYRESLISSALTDISLHDASESLRQQAFHEICKRAESKNENSKTAAILSLKQVSILSRDNIVKRDALRKLDEIRSDQPENPFLASFGKWVLNKLPRGYLSQEDRIVEVALYQSEIQSLYQSKIQSYPDPYEIRSNRSQEIRPLVDIVKWASFFASEEPIPSILVETQSLDFRLGLQKVVNLGLIKKDGETYRISERVKANIFLKEDILKDLKNNKGFLLSLAQSLNEAWNFNVNDLDTYNDLSLPLHIESFIENLPTDLKTTDPMVVPLTVFFHRLGLYHLFVKKDVKKALESFWKTLLYRFDLIPEEKKEVSPRFVLPKKEEVLYLFDTCKHLEKDESILIFNQDSDDNNQLLNALIKAFPDTSSISLGHISIQKVEALIDTISGSRVINLGLYNSDIDDEWVQALAKKLLSSQVTSLDLSGGKIGDEGAKVLAALLSSSQLSKLNLSNNQVGDEGARALAASLPSSKLTSLNLGKNRITNEGAKDFASSITSSKITDLNLYHNQVTDEGAEALAIALPLSNLTTLNLGENQISHLGAKALAASLSSSKLTNLDLQSNRIGNQGAKAFATSIPSSKLTKLNLYFNQISLEGAEALGNALRSSKLTTLYLYHKEIKHEGAGIIPNELLNTYLRLDYTGNQRTALLGTHPFFEDFNSLAELQSTKALNAVFPSYPLKELYQTCSHELVHENDRYFGQLTSNPNARALNLYSMQVNDRVAKVLADALPSSHLMSLNIHLSLIGDQGAVALAKALPSSQLIDLRLSGTQISHVGARAIAASLPFSILNGLDLSNSKINDGSAEALAEALPSCQLTLLNLQRNQIGFRGATALAMAVPLSKLSNLYLNGNLIGDEGAKAFAASLPSFQQTTLDLSLSQIGNEGAKALAAALPSSRLIKLNLQGNQIGDEGAEALAAALPSSRLTELNLQGNQIGDEGAKSLFSKLSSSRLTDLNLSQNKISSRAAQSVTSSRLTNLNLSLMRQEGIEWFARVLPSTQITDLNLEGDQIRDRGAIFLANLLATSEITNLNLRNNYIGGEGAKALFAALPSSKLISLDLSNNSFLGAELDKIRGLPSTPSKLKTLNLSESGIEAEGAKALAAWLISSNLSSLNLGRNFMSEEGAKAIAAVLPTSQLTNLDLNYSNIGIGGAEALAESLPFSKLTHLNLSFCQMFEEGFAALTSSIPFSNLINLDLGGSDLYDQEFEALAALLVKSQIITLSLRGSNFGRSMSKYVIALNDLKNRNGAKIQVYFS